MSYWLIYYNISYQQSNHDRTCKKLQRLVGDREVWVGHLQGIDRFSKEVVEKLALFGANGSPEMMGEVLKAAATRLEISGAAAVRIKVSVQGWGDPVTVNLAGQNFEDLTVVARGVGAKLIVEEVECSDSKGGEKILQIIVSHMENQKEQLAYTEFNYKPWLSSPGADDLFVLLLKVSKSWKVGRLITDSARNLARFPTDVLAAGQIGEMLIFNQRSGKDLDALRRFWEVTEKLIIWQGDQDTTVGGGRGENPDADWQRVLDIFLPSE